MNLEKLWLLLVLAISCWKIKEGDAKSRAGDSILKFNMKLFQNLLTQEEENVVISPASIYTSLAMLQQGSYGSSKVQLSKILRSSPYHTRHRFRQIIRSFQSLGNSTLEFANRVFVQSGLQIEPRYRSIVTRDFFSDVEGVNFTSASDAAVAINSWVANHTHERIPELLSPQKIQSDQKLLLASAIYFKSAWEQEFDKSLTVNSTFSPSPGKELNVSCMTSISQYLAGENHKYGFKWVQIPFKGNRFTMLLVLPNEKYTVNELLKKMPSKSVYYLLKHSYSSDVVLKIPKFRLVSEEVQIISALKKMGLKDVFKGGKTDLRLISKEPLYLSDIVHKAELEIDEEGAVASAATGVGAMPLSAVQRPVLTFHADHPFAAFVVDRQNNIPLFSARIVDPTKI
ncbi:putative serpin-like protein [Blattella germanica]|nr:putative serpin-like protein [Blattella germanica]